MSGKARQTNSNSVGCAVLILLLLVGMMTTSLLGLLNFGPSRQNKVNKTTQAQQTAAQNKQLLHSIVDNDLAAKYCEAFNGYRFDVAEFSQGNTKPKGATKGKYSAEECKILLNHLVEKGSDERTLRTIAQAKVSIGMTVLELMVSWGVPNDLNTTKTSYMNSGQWVYGDPLSGANYVYTDNGKVTSLQNF